MNLCGFLIVHNEEEKGNIRRCLVNMEKLCDTICVYDDASTDNTVKICRKYTPHVLVGKENIGFPNKPQKNILMRYALEKIRPDFFWWQDADEIVDQAGLDGGVRELCERAEREGIDAFEFHEVNLYLSESWHRIDRMYGLGWFCRLWRNFGGLAFQEERSLHPVPYPTAMQRIEKARNIQVIHYGFSSLCRIVDKYLMYRRLGQRGELMDRLAPVGEMVLKPMDPNMFPKENAPKPEAMPKPLTDDEWRRATDV